MCSIGLENCQSAVSCPPGHQKSRNQSFHLVSLNWPILTSVQLHWDSLEQPRPVGALQPRDLTLLTDTRSFSCGIFKKCYLEDTRYSQILDISRFVLTSNGSVVLILRALLKFNLNIIYLVKWDGSVLNQ